VIFHYIAVAIALWFALDLSIVLFLWSLRPGELATAHLRVAQPRESSYEPGEFPETRRALD
jgi:hypothetical protein